MLLIFSDVDAFHPEALIKQDEPIEKREREGETRDDPQHDEGVHGVHAELDQHDGRGRRKMTQ